MFVSAACSDAAKTMRANQGETFRDHPRRAVEIANNFDQAGRESGLFLKLLDRSLFDSLVILVADEACRELDALAFAQWCSRLFDQYDLAVMFGENDDGMHAAASLDIFPPAVADDAQILAFPLDGAPGHSSISLSGISLVSSPLFGKCWARTSPMISTAAMIP